MGVCCAIMPKKGAAPDDAFQQVDVAIADPRTLILALGAPEANVCGKVSHTFSPGHDFEFCFFVLLDVILMELLHTGCHVIGTLCGKIREE